MGIHASLNIFQNQACFVENLMFKSVQIRDTIQKYFY